MKIIKIETKIKFKILASIVLYSSLFMSCETNVPNKRVKSDLYSGMGFDVITVDSCEYLMLSSDIRSLTHQGNCSFCRNWNLKHLKQQ